MYIYFYVFNNHLYILYIFIHAYHCIPLYNCMHSIICHWIFFDIQHIHTHVRARRHTTHSLTHTHTCACMRKNTGGGTPYRVQYGHRSKLYMFVVGTRATASTVGANESSMRSVAATRGHGSMWNPFAIYEFEEHNIATKTFNAIFDNNGCGFDDLPLPLQKMYIVHIGQGEDRVLGTLWRKQSVSMNVRCWGLCY